MTLEKAKKVAILIGNCDGGCPICIADLAYKATEMFPEFNWVYNENYKDDDGRVIVEEA